MRALPTASMLSSVHQPLVIFRPSIRTKQQLQVSATRKMCGVLHRYLGKGARCALPLHPSGPGSVWGLTPSRAIRTYRRSIPRNRAFALPCPPSTKGRSCPFGYPDHFMETKDGSFSAALPWNLPIDQPLRLDGHIKALKSCENFAIID